MMSLRAHTLLERVRDLTVRSDSTDVNEQASRDAVGREVLQALDEIDRVARAAIHSPGAPGAAAGGATPIRAMVSPGMHGAVGATTDARGAAARSAASPISAGISIRVTGRPARRV
jgi:hypothetical protein